MGTAHPQQMPLMHTGDGGTRIAHREYCFDVNMYTDLIGTTPHITFYNITPLNATIFPWLSGIAPLYEQYKFVGLTFGFRGFASNTTTEGSLGSVSFATQYDVYDPYYSKKAEMLNAMFSTSCKPTDQMLHPIECDPYKTPSLPRYTNAHPTTTAPPRDFNLYVSGRLAVCATKGVPAGSGPGNVYSCGELWVSYDIMLYKPQTYLTDTPSTLPLDNEDNHTSDYYKVLKPPGETQASNSTSRDLLNHNSSSRSHR